MLDITYIRENATTVKDAVRNKKVDVDIDRLMGLDDQRKQLQTELDETQRQRNILAEGISTKPSDEQVEQGSALKQKAQDLQARLDVVQEALEDLSLQVPNIPTHDTPVAEDEAGNSILRQWGDQPSFSFKAKPHDELGEQLDVIDTQTAATVAGSRFAYLKGELVFLEFALIQFVLNTVTDTNRLAEIAKKAELDITPTPFTPIIPPAMLRPNIMQRMGRLEPKEDRYHIPSDDLYLNGSAEHTLGPLLMDTTVPFEDLPIRFVGFSTSFRREAGSHGKDVRGIMRQHQFDKVELETFTAATDSTAEHLFLIAIQEYLMQQLKLPYQVVLKCTGDMGTPNARAVDIETWLPSQEAYRETHSADLMTDWQARRLRAKYRTVEGDSTYLHMNDATAFAIGRTLVAVMENNQQADGSVDVPEVLHPYLPFTVIAAPKSTN